MAGGTMERSEKYAHQKQREHQGNQYDCRALRRSPQIVGPPANRFGSVAVPDETGDELDGKYNPRIPRSVLKLPNKPGDVSTERERLDEL